MASEAGGVSERSGGEELGQLVVLDFDWTVINCNSDVDILKHFTDDWAQCSARLDESGASGAWTEGMDREMGLLHEHGCTVQQLEEFLMSIKIERELSDALKLASTRDAAVYILSDANTWFIDAILRANGLRDDIKCVCSNPVVFEECGRVRVRPFHTTPHPEGSSSPPNLCKGRVMDGWLRTVRDGGKVVYAGDGEGDFEGAMRVPAGGVILARSGWSLHKRLQAAADQGQGPAAEVRTWETQVQLAALLLEVLDISTADLVA
eukprot:Tamp_27836.p1 GENE.Tamp_27836~~Tamp_27836.p1  ORF type:complete len:277 (-),score=58.51 Tamp_27836:7-798(-)